MLRDGNSVPAVFNSESQAASFIRAARAKETVVHADEAARWDDLHERFEIKGSNHQTAYSLDGTGTLMAADRFFRLRRVGIGVRDPVAGSCVLRSAQDSSRRQDDRSVSHDAAQIIRIAAPALRYATTGVALAPVAARRRVIRRTRSATPANAADLAVDIRIFLIEKILRS